jgi:ClpP class serine protease
MLDTFYKKFLQVVYKNRNRNGKIILSMEEIEKIADGRVYLAQKAFKLKLIDGIGYFDDALKKILSLAHIRDATVIAYTYHPPKKTNIYANTAAQGNPFTVEIKAFENLFPSLKTGIYYLWLPGSVKD